MASMLSSDKAYEKCGTDNHTVSIFSRVEFTDVDLHSSITYAAKQYVSRHVATAVSSLEFTIGGTHTSKEGMYVFAFVRDVVLCNLLVGKSEDGNDLCEIIYESTSGKQLDVSEVEYPDLVEDLSLVDVTLDDLVEDNSKVKHLTDMVRGLDRSKRYDVKKKKKKWLPPLIPVLLKGQPLKIIPAKFTKKYGSTIQQKILCVSLGRNEVSHSRVDAILDKVCIREQNVSFYIKNTSIKGRSPLVIKEGGNCEIHFTSDIQAKMCYFMLKDFFYRTTSGEWRKLMCEFKQVNSSLVYPKHQQESGRRRNVGKGRGDSGMIRNHRLVSARGELSTFPPIPGDYDRFNSVGDGRRGRQGGDRAGVGRGNLHNQVIKNLNSRSGRGDGRL